MITIKKLRFSGIGRFAEESEIDFSSRSSLIQVDGQNNNTGASSGSGKSTIFNAIDLLFGLSNIPATVLKSRVSDGPVFIECQFSDENLNYTLSRKNTSLTLEIQETQEKLSGNNKLVEERLDDIFGLPRALVGLMIHKRQGEGGFFLSLSPKEAHEFVTECTGQSKWSKAAEKCSNDVSSTLKDLERYDSEFNALNQSKGSLSLGLESISKPVASFDSSQATLLEAAIVLRSEKIKTLKRDYQAEVASIPEPKAVPFQYDMAAFTEINNKINDLKEKRNAELSSITSNRIGKMSVLRQAKDSLSDLKKKEGQIALLSQTLAVLKQEIISFKGDDCPTCLQSWNSEDKKEKVSKKIKDFNTLDQKIKELSVEVQHIHSVESTISRIESEIEGFLEKERGLESKYDFSHLTKQKQELDGHYATAMAECHALNSEIKENYFQKQKTITENWTLKIKQLEDQQKQDQEAIDRIRFQEAYFKKALEEYETSTKALKKKLAEVESKLIDITNKKQFLTLKNAAAAESLRAIKGYMSDSFSDFLSMVSDRATEILSKIPNMANSTVTLDSQKETKGGVVKEEINAIITMDGETGVPIKSLSGGERTSVDLAIDLAVIDILEMRFGKGVNLLILDEPFNGLDSVSTESCLELLTQSGSKKQIVIVDHAEECKQLLSDKIIVVRDGAFSKIKAI